MDDEELHKILFGKQQSRPKQATFKAHGQQTRELRDDSLPCRSGSWSPTTTSSICFLTSIAEDDAAQEPLRYPTVDYLEPMDRFRRRFSLLQQQSSQNSHYKSWDAKFFLFTDIPPLTPPRGWTILQQPQLRKRHGTNSTNSTTTNTFSNKKLSRESHSPSSSFSSFVFHDDVGSRSVSLQTLERWSQYVPWQHPRIVQDCRIVFFLSFLESLSPLAPPHVFVDLAQTMLVEDQGLRDTSATMSRTTTGLALHRDTRFPTLQDLQQYIEKQQEQQESSNNQENDLSEEWTRTLELIQQQETHHQNPNNNNHHHHQQQDSWKQAPVYQTTWMGMDLHNPRVRTVTQDFWELYQTEDYTVYDAFLFSYLLYRHGIHPWTNHDNDDNQKPRLPPLDELMDVGYGRIVPNAYNSLGRLVVAPPPIQPVVSSSSSFLPGEEGTGTSLAENLLNDWELGQHPPRRIPSRVLEHERNRGQRPHDNNMKRKHKPPTQHMGPTTTQRRRDGLAVLERQVREKYPSPEALLEWAKAQGGGGGGGGGNKLSVQTL